MSSTCRGDGRMDHFCRLILLLVLVLSLSALPVVLVGAQCPVLQANESHVELCADSCESQLRNRNVSSNESYALRREADSIFCYQYCELAYTRGLCHCRTAKCWRSLPCLVACGIAGVFDHVASGTNTLQTCLRTTVYPDRSISMDVAWLPLVHDLKHLGLISTYGATYRPADSVNDGNFVVDHPHQVYRNSLLPGVLHVSCDVTNTDTSYQWNNIVPYNVIIFLRRIDYQIVGQPRHTELHNHRREEQRPFISSPACHHVVDNLSRCLDKQYNITMPTEYYDKIVITDFKVQNAKGGNTVAASSIVDGAGLESCHYTLALDALWWYELFEHRGTGLTASAWDHAAQSCTPHSCWCWESCAVQHRVSLDVIVNDDLAMRYNHTMDFVEEQEDDYVHCPNIRVNRSFSVDIPATNLLLGRIADSSLLGTELVNVSVTASIQSYYVVDKYFGPLQKSSIITYSLVDIPVYLKDPSKEDNDHTSPPSNTSTPPHTAFANTMSSKNTATSRSPGRIPHTSVSAVADGQSVAMEIIVPVVMVILLAVMGVGGLIFIRMWRYQKWRPRCVAKNSTLEKLHQLPVQTITNDGYQALKSDWPAVRRNCINLELQLGSGQFGEVYKATVTNLIPREAATQVAVKVLKQGSSPKDEHDFLLEATHLKNFRHPNVIRLLGVCLDEHPKMIILELMDGGDLLSYLQANQPGAARPAWDDAEYIDIALDITAGLRYLETEKYVHRDVAARNCLVSFCPKNSSLAVKPSSSGRIVKIADFGLARDIDQRHYYRLLPDREALLPLRWLAPESLQKKIFTTKSDVWSFGILLWEIYTYGQLPYGEKTQGHEIYTFVLMGGTLDQPQFCPNAMYKLMKHAWAKSPADRPTFTQLRDHLSTFQNSLSRRKTLLTTLASFASVSGIGEVERANLPHIPPSQRVMVAPRPSSAQGSVFDSESMASDSENVFESPAVTPAVTPLSHRRTAAGFQPQTQPKFSSDFLTIPDAAISTRQLQQHQPQSRKSRCDSATGDGIATSETSPVKTLREFPVTANGISSPGYTAVVSTSHNHLPPFGSTALEQSTPKQRQCSPESHPTPLVITEFASRKTLSPIVSASSTTDDGMEPSSSLLTGARRKTRSTNSSSSRRKPSYSETCL
ncbi:tyrosine-protein kinase receptor-like [Sycon ciliatum]|uniref:tyrosine-protein kinase receptor-like n=1 Tax=Sycon ciliatum TaxID=27933 RepID=UPI0031F6FFCC